MIFNRIKFEYTLKRHQNFIIHVLEDKFEVKHTLVLEYHHINDVNPNTQCALATVILGWES